MVYRSGLVLPSNRRSHLFWFTFFFLTPNFSTKMGILKFFN